MSESSNSSRSTSKSDSLINITHDRIFANFDTAIKNHRLSSISNETYDKIAHSGDMPMRFMII